MRTLGILDFYHTSSDDLFSLPHYSIKKKKEKKNSEYELCKDILVRIY